MSTIKLYHPLLHSWLLPYHCFICNNRSDQHRDLCSACEQELPWLSTVCKRCGIPLDTTQQHLLCGQCQQKPPPFNHCHAVFHYQRPIDKLITGIKFHHKLVFTKLLSELFIKDLLTHKSKTGSLPEVIIPVPLHKSRLHKRGFNQALELAKPIAKQLRIRIDNKHCQRIRATQAQSLIPAKEREKNMRNAFIIKKNFVARHVAIFDDVVTTGNTVAELSRQLRHVGVKNIEVWCLARTTT